MFSAIRAALIKQDVEYNRRIRFSRMVANMTNDLLRRGNVVQFGRTYGGTNDEPFRTNIVVNSTPMTIHEDGQTEVLK
jgi:hypothetical protein